MNRVRNTLVAAVGMAALAIVWSMMPGELPRAVAAEPAATAGEKPAAKPAEKPTDKPAAAATSTEKATSEKAISEKPATDKSSTEKPSTESGKPRDITFDSIKFEMKDPKSRRFKRSLLTKKIEELDGTNVRIRGYILPPPTRVLTKFVLVRDNMECCFGPGAALYDCVLVELEEGVTTEYTTRPVAVEGKFTVSEYKGPDGKHLAIYHLVGKAVTTP